MLMSREGSKSHRFSSTSTCAGPSISASKAKGSNVTLAEKFPSGLLVRTKTTWTIAAVRPTVLVYAKAAKLLIEKILVPKKLVPKKLNLGRLTRLVAKRRPSKYSFSCKDRKSTRL